MVRDVDCAGGRAGYISMPPTYSEAVLRDSSLNSTVQLSFKMQVSKRVRGVDVQPRREEGTYRQEG